MPFHKEVIKDEILQSTTLGDFVVSDYISRRFYSFVAINQSIEHATDFGWLPYKWDSLFHGLISDLDFLPIIGTTPESSEAFCFALGGEVCDSKISEFILKENWKSLGEQLRKCIVVEQGKFRKTILENEALGGQYAPRSEFYFKKFIQKLKLDESLLLKLPILNDELVIESETSEIKSYIEPAYLKRRVSFQIDEMTIDHEEVLPEMILNAGFRCKWSRSKYEKLLSDFYL